ncbi:GNAT family N-acetyltransferase [Flavobacteriaceae bacterium F08102]|nr:GNAT family N-acetyltransferase [Flavobacteriaceae bacterium F08102]
MPNYQIIETARLLLKPTGTTDAQFIYELMNSPKWRANIGNREIYSIHDAQQYIQEHMLPQLERLGYSNYTLVRKSDGAKIGSCGLYERKGINGVDIGYAMLPTYEKRGYAFESANALKQHAFEKFEVTKLSALTLPTNKASQHLLKKLGLSYKKRIHLLGDPTALILFSLSAKRYFENKNLRP